MRRPPWALAEYAEIKTGVQRARLAARYLRYPRRMIAPRVRAYLRFLGANVHRSRMRNRLTQEAFSEATGLDVRFIRRVERGDVNLRFDTVIRLADALGVEPGSLLRRAKTVPPRAGRPRRERRPT